MKNLNLTKTLGLIVLGLQLVSCGKDNDAGTIQNGSIAGGNLTCFRADGTSYFVAQNQLCQDGSQPTWGNPGNNGWSTISYDQVQDEFEAMTMQTNAKVNDSFTLQESTFRTRFYSLKSITAQSVVVEERRVLSSGIEDEVDYTKTLDRSVAMDEIFGSNLGFGTEVNVTPISICLVNSFGAMSRRFQGYLIQEMGNGILVDLFQNGVKSERIVSSEVSLFTNPIFARGTEYDREVKRINGLNVVIGCR
jgi:hypothetical protein